MLPSAYELKYFAEVAHTLNISRASERLGISQPTLSLSIQKLESALGLPLLIRTKAGVKLTRAGQRFATQARELLSEWEKITESAKREESQIAGRYGIGCHSSVGLYSLSHFLPMLLEENPELEIKLTHDLSRKIMEEVVSFRVDFGIVVNPPSHPDLVIKTLCKDEVTLWTSSKPSRMQDPKSPDRVLLCEPDLLQTQSLVKSLARAGLSFPRMVTSSNLEVICSLVSSGAGVGILPTRVATRIREQGLKLLSKTGPVFEDRVCLIYRADAQKTKASRAIAQTIQKNLSAAWAR